MGKIQSRSGDSLADIYDVVGSIAGIEQLETRELPIVHEMGATLFSERFSSTIRRAAAGAIAQNTDFEVILTDLPDVPTRLIGIAVISNDVTRISNAAVMIRSPGADRELPVWVFDQTNSLRVRIRDEGARANADLLLSSVGVIMLPGFVGGLGQPHPSHVEEIVLAGLTTGFGAGTVTITGLYQIAFSQVGGISSRGLPIPSW